MNSVPPFARNWADKMKVSQLRKTLQAGGLATTGNKADLVLRLEDAVSKDLALDGYFREEREEEEDGLHWLNSQAARQKRKLEEEEEHDEWGCDDNDAKLDVIGYLKDFGKKKITEARASLRELELEDARDRARLEYKEYQLDKLVSDIKARKKIIREKEDDLRKKKRAIDLFQSAFNC